MNDAALIEARAKFQQTQRAEARAATAAETRSAAPGRSAPVSRVSPAERAKALAEAQEIIRKAKAAAHVPSLRSDVLAAELATAKTKAERRAVVDRFMATQRSPEDARFAQWLRDPGHSRAYEDRAAGEGSGSSGGYLVPPKFYDAVIWQLRDYDGLIRDFELWESAHGEATTRPIAAQFTAAVTGTENTAFTEGPYPALTQQSWGQTPTYAASFRMSNQLAQDAFREEPGGYATSVGGKVVMTSAPVRNPLDTVTPELDAYVSRALGESLGRVIAPVAATALYSAISAQGAVSDSGGYLALGAATPVTFATGAATTELAANTITLDTAAQLTGAIDEAYQEGAKFYMTRKQWAGMIRQVDSQKHVIVQPNGERSLYGFPVVVTSQTSAAAASTVAGPVFGNLEAALTLRVVGNTFSLLRSTEKYAEFLQTYYRGVLRADVQTRDARALVGVQYNAS